MNTPSIFSNERMPEHQLTFDRQNSSIIAHQIIVDDEDEQETRKDRETLDNLKQELSFKREDLYSSLPLKRLNKSKTHIQKG